MFYTNEEWELLDPNLKDLEESMAQEERKKPAPEGNKGTDVVPVAHPSLRSAGAPVAPGFSGSGRHRGSRPLWGSGALRACEVSYYKR